MLEIILLQYAGWFLGVLVVILAGLGYIVGKQLWTLWRYESSKRQMLEAVQQKLLV